MNLLKHEKKLAVLTALVEGKSIRATVRMTGVHKTTILRLIRDVGDYCTQIMDREMRRVRCAEIEADEIWALVGKKQKRLTEAEKAAGELGAAYTFIAVDPRTKLVPVFKIGKRNWTTTGAFIRVEGAGSRAHPAQYRRLRALR